MLTNHARLHLFTGTSEILCRAVLLDQDEIGPGESGYVQLRLEEKIAVRRGDKFVVRFYSPMETIGGGVILEPNPKIKRRFREDIIEELKRKESGGVTDVIEMHVKEHGNMLIAISELAKLTALSAEEVTEAVAELEGEGTVLTFPLRKDTFVWSADESRAALRKISQSLKRYESDYPYRYGMKKAEVQMMYFKKTKPAVYDKIIEHFISLGEIKRVDEFLSTPDYEVKKDAVYEKVSRILLNTWKKAEYDFVRYSEIDKKGVPDQVADDILNILLEERTVVKVTDDMYTLTKYMEEAKERIREHLAADPVITIAQVRDMFGTSRKSARPILEYMDSIKITRKTGAESERVKY